MVLKKLVKLKKLLLFTKASLFGALLFLPNKAFSKPPVRVAFFISYDHHNNLIELVPGGRFYHAAIQIDGHWYHSSPTNGVERVRSLVRLSEEGLFVVNVLESRVHELSFSDIKPYLGQPFDYLYDWDAEDKTDCTKFIAKLVDILPTPTSFAGAHWTVDYGFKAGGEGLSPDELYRRLREIGFSSIKDKAGHLRSKQLKTCKVSLKAS